MTYRDEKLLLIGRLISCSDSDGIRRKVSQKNSSRKKRSPCVRSSESFTKNSTFSTLAGVVLRRDMIIDGVVLGRALVGGDDATKQIITMFKKLDRSDVNCIMINGLIISLYNVVAGEEILETTGIPVIGVTYKDSQGIEDRFFDRFARSEAIRRVEAYRKLGNRERITLKTGMVGLHSKLGNEFCQKPSHIE